MPKACGDRVHPGSAESGVGFRVLRRTLCRGESWICGENWMWPTTLLKPRLCRLYRNPFGASWSDLVASGVPFSLLGFVPKLSLVYYVSVFFFFVSVSFSATLFVFMFSILFKNWVCVGVDAGVHPADVGVLMAGHARCSMVCAAVDLGKEGVRRFTYWFLLEPRRV